MIQLDVRTAFVFSACLAVTISIAILFYSLSRKENRTFIWLSIASGVLAANYVLTYLRGQIPDFFSIIVSNELIILCLIAFYEVFHNFLSLNSKGRFLGPCVLGVQLLFLIWYTYFNPDFRIRVVVVSCSLSIMSIHIVRLILSNSTSARNPFHLFAVTPFIILSFFSVIRIGYRLWDTSLSEDSFTSSAYAFSIVFYGMLVVWVSFSVVFISADGLQNKLSQIALIDPLTGALNRRALKEAVSREIARAKRTGLPLSLIITDLDHFKKINDTYGHQAGDAVLSHTVQLYNELLRTEDLLARFGGEEFVVVLPGVNMTDGFFVAERLRLACEKARLLYENQSISVTSSFGMAGFSDRVLDFEILIRQADEALYRAKEEGRNRVVLFEGMELKRA